MSLPSVTLIDNLHDESVGTTIDGISTKPHLGSTRNPVCRPCGCGGIKVVIRLRTTDADHARNALSLRDWMTQIQGPIQHLSTLVKHDCATLRKPHRQTSQTVERYLGMQFTHSMLYLRGDCPVFLPHFRKQLESKPRNTVAA